VRPYLVERISIPRK